MTKINPYLAEIRSRGVLDDLNAESLATLAVAHELAEANALTEAVNAPARFVLGAQDPISPEDLKEAMNSSKIRALPDDSGDARIAEAARRWAKAAIREVQSPGTGPAVYGLATRELFEAIQREDER